MEATLTELRRQTNRVVRPAMHGGEEVTITEHGQAKFKLVPIKPALDRKAALKALEEIGPVELKPRS